MFTPEEIKAANRTCRATGMTALNRNKQIRAVVPKWIVENLYDKNATILDFGAGKEAIQTQWLRNQGLKVTAYEFGDNLVPGVHNPDALKHKYDIVMMSNVCNIQTSETMLKETLQQVKSVLDKNSVVVLNFPDQPRKIDESIFFKVLRETFEYITGINKNIYMCS